MFWIIIQSRVYECDSWIQSAVSGEVRNRAFRAQMREAASVLQLGPQRSAWEASKVSERFMQMEILQHRLKRRTTRRNEGRLLDFWESAEPAIHIQCSNM